MILALLALAPAIVQAGAAIPAAAVPTAAHCAELALSDPAAGRAEAERWRIAGGGAPAERCAGLAEAAQGRWIEAAQRFESGADLAGRTHDPALADLDAQAGNAWLAAGQPAKATIALDAALAAGTLVGQPLGEAELDKARAAVAAGDLDGGRAAIDLALKDAPADPLAWLLSATLARRQNDVRRARTDIAEALKRSPDDASVQLEAGNVAAFGGDEAGAREAWGEAARLAPDRPQGKAAVAALRQFDGAASSSSTKSTPAR